MRKSRMGVVLLPVLMIVVLIGVIGYFATQNLELTKRKSLSSQPSTTPSPERSGLEFAENDSCDKLNLQTYYVNNEYNKYQFCYPTGWEIKDLSAKGFDGQYLSLKGKEDKSVITIWSRIFKDKVTNNNTAYRFQFTNIDFEQSKDIQGNATNPQFKILEQTVYENSNLIFHTHYNYKVYKGLPQSNHEERWILRGNRNPSVYYEITYGHMSNWEPKLISKNTGILNTIVETFRD